MPTELTDETGDLIREIGHEYGTTTGRPRRCGWFDGVAARHAMRINGFDRLALTRLDILDRFPALRICVAYELDGERLEQFPASESELGRCRPIYEELPGWQTSLSSATTYAELPAQARRFAERIAELLGAPIAMVGVGEGRDQSIVLDNGLLG
jgi:adenylosuccinate synthase